MINPNLTLLAKLLAFYNLLVLSEISLPKSEITFCGERR